MATQDELAKKYGVSAEEVERAFSGPQPSFVSASEDFIANLARSAVLGFAEPLQKYNELIGATSDARGLAELRQSMMTNEVGDVLPTNPELNNTFLSGLGRGMGRSIPDALIASAGPAGFATIAGKMGLSTQLHTEEAQAAYDEQMRAYEAGLSPNPPDGPRPSAVEEQIKGGVNLAAQMLGGRLVAPLTNPLLARALPSLRTPLGIASQSAGNFGADILSRSALNAYDGKSLLPFANPGELGEAFAADVGFSVHPGIAQARDIPKYKAAVEFEKLVADKMAEAEAAAAALAAHPETVAPNKTAPAQIEFKAPTENETGVAIDPAKQTDPVTPTTALPMELQLNPNSAVLVDQTSTKAPQVVVTPKKEATEPAKAEAQPGTPAPVDLAEEVARRQQQGSQVQVILPPEMQAAIDAQRATANRPLDISVPFPEGKTPEAVEARIAAIDAEMRQMESDVLGDTSEMDAQTKKRYQDLERERITLATGQEPVDLTQPLPVGTREVRPDLSKAPPPFTAESEVKPLEFTETQKAPAVKPDEVTEVVKPGEPVKVSEDLTKLTDDQLAEQESIARQTNDQDTLTRIEGEYDRRANAAALGETPTGEERPAGVQDQVAEDTQRGAGVPGDEAVTGERWQEPVPAIEADEIQHPGSKDRQKSDNTVDFLNEQVRAAEKLYEEARARGDAAGMEEMQTRVDDLKEMIDMQRAKSEKLSRQIGKETKKEGPIVEQPVPGLTPEESAELAANREEQQAFFKKPRLTAADNYRIEKLQERADELEAKMPKGPAPAGAKLYDPKALANQHADEPTLQRANDHVNKRLIPAAVKVMESIFGKPIRVEFGPRNNHNFGIRIENDGSLVLEADPNAGAWFRHYRRSNDFKASAYARKQLGEEIIHVAQISGIKVIYEKADPATRGTLGEFSGKFITNIIDGVKNEVARLRSIGQDAKADKLAETIAGSDSLYQLSKGKAGGEALLAAWQQNPAHGMNRILEFDRQLQQYADSGTITETFFNRVLYPIGEWIKGTFNSLKEGLGLAQKGAYGPEFDELFRNTKRQLLGRDISLKEALPNDTINALPELNLKYNGVQGGVGKIKPFNLFTSTEPGKETTFAAPLGASKEQVRKARDRALLPYNERKTDTQTDRGTPPPAGPENGPRPPEVPPSPKGPELPQEDRELNPGFYSKLSQIIDEKLPAALSEIPGMTVPGRETPGKEIRNPKTGELIKTIPPSKSPDQTYPAVTVAHQIEALARQNGVKEEELKWSGIIPWLESQANRGVELFHGTNKPFDKLEDTRGFGLHFGDKEAANTIVENNEKFGRGEGNRIIKARVDLQNPLRMPDIHFDDPYGIAKQLAQQGVISDEQYKSLRESFSGRDEKSSLNSLKKLLQDKGYDGVVYKNEREGNADSLIVFDPSKSVNQAGKVSKESVQDYLRTEGAVKFEESNLGGTLGQRYDPAIVAKINDVARQMRIYREDAENVYGADRDKWPKEVRNGPEITRLQQQHRLLIDERDAKADRTDAKFSQYQLPGGEAYREIVLTVPTSFESIPEELKARVKRATAGKNPYDVSPALIRERGFPELADEWMDALQKSERSNPDFTSSHFPEQGNYVAHMRLNERPDSTGKRGTFIEEIQSDRHQKGREQGYREPSNFEADKREYYQLAARKSTWTPEDKARSDELSKRILNVTHGIPDAPYRKDWGVQMFKRALRDAVAKGQDWVGWTKGQTHTDRWGTERIQWEKQPDGTYLVDAKSQHGGNAGGIDLEGEANARNLNKTNSKKIGSVQELEEAIRPALTEGQKPRELAEKLWKRMQDNPDGVAHPRKEGFDGFYDTILPNEIGKYVKQWGGRVEEGRIHDESFTPKTSASPSAMMEEMMRNLGKSKPDIPFHKVAITPEMREGVSKGLQTLFGPELPGEEGAPQVGQAPGSTPVQKPKTFLEGAFDRIKNLPFIAKIADSKIAKRITERLKPAVQDLRESIEAKFRGMEFLKNNFATQVRRGIDIAFNHNKEDMEAAYPILEAGGGRIGEGPTEAQAKQYQDALEVLKNADIELGGPDLTPEQRAEVQKEIDHAKQVVEDYRNLPPTRDDVYREVQLQLANGKKALESDVISNKAKENIKKWLPAYERALEDFDRLLPGVRRVKEAFDDAFNVRSDAGLDPHYIENYVGRVYEKNPERSNSPLPPESLIGGGRSGISSFDKSRKYDTIMDAMIGRQVNGKHEFETPRGLNVSDLASNHAAVSMDMASNKMLIDQFETTSYPETNEPLFVPKPKVGESLPPNYVRIDGPFKQPIFVYHAIADLFKSIYGESQPRNTDAGSALLKISGAIKHGVLAVDTFHLSRVGQKAFMEAVASGDWQKVADFKKNMPSYTEQGQMGKYLGTLDIAVKDIDAAIKAGELLPEDATWIKGEGQELKKRAEDGGLLSGRFMDNLWKEGSGLIKFVADLVHLPQMHTRLEQFNKFTFERVTKAAMFSAFESRLKRIDKDFPELTQHQRNIKAAKEVNEQFGNIGRSGILKSKTAQDYAQIFMLAPNWVQSQVMAEARQYGQGARAIFDATVGKKLPNGERERVFRVGNSARFLGTTALSVFLANQAINLATRGKPTWENEEEGHKFDAWIPGGKTGFFYSPIALASEYAHHLHNYGQYESLPSAISHIASNKLSPLAGAAKVALTQKDYTGKKLSGTDLALGIARQAAPIPIIGSSAIKGLDDSSKSGTTQQNLLRSAGISTDRAPDAVAIGYKSFQPYRTKDRPDTGPSKYRDLKVLVQNGESPEKIKKEVERLKKEGAKIEDIRRSFDFKNLSGSLANDMKAIKEKPELKKIRDAAIKQKRDEAEAFRKALNTK